MMETPKKMRGRDRQPRQLRGAEKGERASMAPYGDSLVDRVYRLEAKGSTLQERTTRLLCMAETCVIQGAQISWQYRNKMQPDPSDTVLYVKISRASEPNLRKLGSKKGVWVHFAENTPYELPSPSLDPPTLLPEHSLDHQKGAAS